MLLINVLPQHILRSNKWLSTYHLPSHQNNLKKPLEWPVMISNLTQILNRLIAPCSYQEAVASSKFRHLASQEFASKAKILKCFTSVTACEKIANEITCAASIFLQGVYGVTKA